jgi:hypothetical protein
MENLALRVLDKIPKETNLYQLITVLSEKCRKINRSKLGSQKLNPINQVFEDICRGEGEEEPPADAK